jgi:alkylhydroperoxidase family enzyme
MSTTPRLASAVPGRPATFRTMMAHQPELLAAFEHLYGTMWSRGVVDHVAKETVRLRNARRVDCGFCRNVRFSQAREDGLGEDAADLIEDGYESSPLSDAQKRALRLVDGYLATPARLPAEVIDELQRTESAAATVELTLAAALFFGFAKVLIALGAEPEQMETTVLPTPVPPEAGASLDR